MGFHLALREYPEPEEQPALPPPWFEAAIQAALAPAIQAALAPIRQELQGVRQELQDVRQELQDVRQDLQALRQDLRAVSQDVHDLQGGLANLDSDVRRIHRLAAIVSGNYTNLFEHCLIYFI